VYMYSSTPRIPNRTRFEQIKKKCILFFYIYIYASFLENESILILHSVKYIEIMSYKNKIILCVKQREKKIFSQLLFYFGFTPLCP
jgi:hypothetical protein